MFLGASLFAILSIVIWVLSLRGAAELPLYGDPHLWHMHEMLFGYVSAVLTGFLLTAVPNWTGRAPVVGSLLVGLTGLWVAGRAVMLWGSGWVAAGVEVLFLFAVLAITTREVIAGRNWRNLMVVGPVSVFALANLGFHTESALTGNAEYATRAGFVAIMALLMLIGGRITPAFTRNWLKQQGHAHLPPTFGRFDAVSLLVSVLALILWFIVPDILVSAGSLAVAAFLQAVRLGRWGGLRTLPNPILFTLHGCFAMIPLGMLMLAAAPFDWAFYAAGLHVIGIAAIGGMTLAVMLRASMGHTGRPLKSDIWMNAALIALLLASGLRAAWSLWGLPGWMLDLSATLWIVAFGVFALRVGPWLLRPSKPA
ncbi:NnrS protein [Falsiruegeria litorea R37]|uniref:NnrS protein n=1 Tax=Falsiruegeria litorea R37 TaxID=1200284 RepID=A0A1Y5TR67_9RHOB|nr:NnrS protein [Falsiruegeria litorea R37]